MTRLKKPKYKEGDEVIYIGGQSFTGGNEGQRATIKLIYGNLIHLSFKGRNDYGLYWSCQSNNIKPAVLDWDT